MVLAVSPRQNKTPIRDIQANTMILCDFRNKVFDDAIAHKFLTQARFGRGTALAFPFANKERFEVCVMYILCIFAVRARTYSSSSDS
jgi:hypothetical protein